MTFLLSETFNPVDALKQAIIDKKGYSILVEAQDSEKEPQRKAREARNKETMRIYEHAEDKRLAEEKRKIGGMRRYEVDKKVR